MFYKRIFLFAAVLCMLKMAYTQSQTITIFGYVRDVDNNPIEMVNKDGIITLHEIDLDTGRVKGSLTLKEHTFPEKIRIKGDFVYYTYKESLYSDENKRYLWKRPLLE
jgi:hypothetical protein